MTESDGPQDAGRVRSVKSADRTIALLEYLSAAESPRTLRDVTGDLGIPRASAYALLMTLVRTGWVEQDQTGSGFHLGIRALRAGAAYVEHDDVVRRAQPVMNDLSGKLGETIHLARLDGHEIVYLATCPSRHSLAVVSKPGRRLPCWSTGLGKAVLAHRPWPEVDALLPGTLTARTPHSITSRPRLREELETVARRGHAVDEQESTLGLRCFAVPLHFGGAINEALSCSVPLVRLDPAREEVILDALRHARNRITG
ncbi:IclR family transcriptional regulator [Streptomyces johnsoniae]|uniref:IclR family transcriptional regulator n=1 Tax=Streptomyces johnsoniae TaxID=3075532 RepID=A0ABU2S7N1_9ACTN|nr:IclR family transcriptional regulator [Streptomyces sp. DSM 41886]MDT0443849.1 IclR family transcriptional regulator [Streptomyces sp. DSM 41886]